MEYQSKKNRAAKINRLPDPEGIAPRLSELIKWARWGVLLLGAIAAMVSLFFIRDAVSVIIGLFG
jgi:hypothetical protein